MTVLERHELTVDFVLDETADALGYIDDQVWARRVEHRGSEMAAALRELPEGFRIERVQGSVGPGRDPGMELTLLDARRTYPEPIAKVARRRIGPQRISWTGGPQLRDAAQAAAFAVTLRLAVIDAEARA